VSMSKDTANADSAFGSLTCAAVTFTLGNGTGMRLVQPVLATDTYQLPNRVLTVSMRVKTSTPNAVRLGFFDGAAYFYSGYHSGSGQYERLSVTLTVVNSASFATYCGPYITASCTAYLDNAMLVVGPEPVDYLPMHPADDLARCLRYYEVINASGGTAFQRGFWAGAGGANYIEPLRYVRKAIMPTVTKVGTWAVSNCNQPSFAVPDVDGCALLAVSVGVGQVNFYPNGTAACTIEANP